MAIVKKKRELEMERETIVLYIKELTLLDMLGKFL